MAEEDDFVYSNRLETEIDPLSEDARNEETKRSKFGDCFCPSLIPKRYVFVFVGFLASTLAVFFNVNLSLAIVAMVDRSNETMSQAKTSNECLAVPHQKRELSDVTSQTPGEFHYSPQMEGLLLGSVYYGQLVGFIPGGRLSELYGAKKVLIIFILVASLFTALIPIAARSSVYAFIFCRFIIGIGTAPVIPALFYLTAHWIPLSERSLAASLLLAGYGIGTFAAFLTAGVLCASQFLGGWPAVFYVGGLCGLVWSLLCFFLVYETPKVHPTISLKELVFLSRHLESSKHKQIKKIPWKSMVTSVPLWSLSIGYFGQFWILGFYCTTQALYMGTILKLDSITNGEMSSVPHLIRALFACLCGFPADWLVRKRLVSVGFIRKGATALNSIGASVGFIAVILAGCDPLLNTIAFTIGNLIGDFVTFGVCLAGVDIAPNLSGTVSGILSIVGVIPFFAVPALVGWFTRYERTMAQWSYVYYISIGVIVVSTVIYLIFGTSDPQPWGTDDEQPNPAKSDRTEDKK